MTGDQDSGNSALFSWSSRREQRGCPEDGVDPGVASDIDFAAHLLPAQIRRGKLGRRKQKLGMRIDCRSIFLLWPRKHGIVGPQAGLDMRDGNSRGKCSERRAERARRVTLHHDQVWSLLKQSQKCGGDDSNVGVRILPPGAGEMDYRKAFQSELVRTKIRMLPGKDQRGSDALRQQSVRNRFLFDGFGSGSNDQPNVGETQPSP